MGFINQFSHHWGAPSCWFTVDFSQTKNRGLPSGSSGAHPGGGSIQADGSQRGALPGLSAGLRGLRWAQQAPIRCGDVGCFFSVMRTFSIQLFRFFSDIYLFIEYIYIYVLLYYIILYYIILYYITTYYIITYYTKLYYYIYSITYYTILLYYFIFYH